MLFIANSKVSGFSSNDMISIIVSKHWTPDNEIWFFIFSDGLSGCVFPNHDHIFTYQKLYHRNYTFKLKPTWFLGILQFMQGHENILFVFTNLLVKTLPFVEFSEIRILFQHRWSHCWLQSGRSTVFTGCESWFRPHRPWFSDVCSLLGVKGASLCSIAVVVRPVFMTWPFAAIKPTTAAWRHLTLLSCTASVLEPSLSTQSPLYLSFLPWVLEAWQHQWKTKALVIGLIGFPKVQSHMEASYLHVVNWQKTITSTAACIQLHFLAGHLGFHTGLTTELTVSLC